VEEAPPDYDAIDSCLRTRLVTNCLKHAFPNDRTGAITIFFKEVDGQYTLAVKDNGVGLPADLDIDHLSSLGLSIVNSLCSQLGGTIGMGRGRGSKVSITFPSRANERESMTTA